MEPQAKCGRHKVRWLVPLGAMVLLVVVASCHPWHKHVDGVHDALADAENICVQLHTSEIEFDTARNNVRDILENNELGWESRNTVNFVVTTIQCSDTSDLSFYEIETHVWDDVVEDGPCDPGQQACVRWIELASVHDEIEEDYDKIHVHFNAQDIVPGAKLRFLVNHEYGHVVGLADPTPEPDVVDNTAEHCRVWAKVDFLGKFFVPAPVPSIMHDRYCPQVSPGSDLEWPTLYDFISFDENVR